MKLEPNMYVRIKWGNGLQTISKCTNKVDMGDTQYSNNDFYIHTDHSGEVIYKTMIVKSSFNIIDLVECGDYVNGSKVIEIEKDYKFIDNEIRDILWLDNKRNNAVWKETIKSIVTKEQFENIKYEI